MSTSIRPLPFLDSLTSSPPPHTVHLEDHTEVIHFLSIHKGNRATFEAYRRELERLLQWGWLITKKSIISLAREDIEQYIQFCMKPPRSWIAKKHVPRYLNKAGERIPNPKWRPFEVKVSKNEYKKGNLPSTTNYQLSPSSLRALFAILGSFYNHLLREEKIQRNPITLIRQKSRYLQKKQTKTKTIGLSDHQWQACLHAAKSLEDTSGNLHQRTLFIMTAMYLLHLRISAFSASERWIPLMNHFYQDNHKQWWFKTLRDGDKIHTVSVSDEMLTALIHYRQKLGLAPLPSPTDNSPLIPKVKGQGPMESTRHIRRLIQACFNQAAMWLREKNLTEEANALETATVYWLRQTEISDDANKGSRPTMNIKND